MRRIGRPLGGRLVKDVELWIGIAANPFGGLELRRDDRRPADLLDEPVSDQPDRFARCRAEKLNLDRIVEDGTEIIDRLDSVPEEELVAPVQERAVFILGDDVGFDVLIVRRQSGHIVQIHCKYP